MKKKLIRDLIPEREVVRKFWMVMRFTLFLLLVSLVHVSASVYSQNTRLDVSVENASLVQVFKLIQEKSEFDFFYNNDQIPSGLRVSVQVRNKTVEEILDTVLEGTGLNYYVVDKDIVIRTVEPGNKQSIQDQKSVSGKVTDSRNQPLPGVTVVVKGTVTGTVTDANGNFSLANVPPDATLVFSFVGMRAREMPVEGKAAIDVTLEDETIGIEEVVAIGYGTQKKVNLTGAVSHVTSEVLKDRPISNVGQGLQGVIPNLQITFPDGDPKSTPRFNIRGTATISGEGGNPLILVDGIQMDINMLNPNDIESISVLKDAASAAIYGARGAFGVILVTTKMGNREREPQVSYSGNMQMNTYTYLPDVFNAVDYVNASNEAQFNANKTYKYSTDQVKWVKEYNEDPLNNPVYHVLANGKIFWNGGLNNSFKELLRDWFPTKRHMLSLAGGTSRLSYYTSIGYQNQEGIFKDDITDYLNKYNFTLNLILDATDWLKIGFKTQYNRTVHDEPLGFKGGESASMWEQFTRGEPQILYPILTPDYAPVGGGIPTEHHANFRNKDSRNTTNNESGIYSFNAEANLFKGFSLKGDFSYQTKNLRNKRNLKEFGFIRDSWALQYNHSAPSYVTRETSNFDYFATNLYGDYTLKIDDSHNFRVLLGFNQEWNTYGDLSVKRENLISGDIPVIRLGLGETYLDDSESAWAIRGVFMRFNYDFKGKYLMEMNGRYDGTSKFPKDSRFAFFPSLSLGWRISQESFMEGVQNVLNDLKLRASYGSLGNQNVSGNYPYISLFGINPQVPYIINGSLPIGLMPPGLVAADLTWETSTTLNFGLDATVFNKLNFSFDWYRRTTSDMLTAGDKLPAILGTAVPRRNNAELETTGWELALKWRDSIKNRFKYDFGLVLSDYSAIVTKYDNNPNKIYTSYYADQRIGEIWGYETIGIFQTTEEVASAPSQNQLGNNGKWGPGDVRYANLNDDNVINWGDRTVGNPGDTKIIGDSTPRYQFGITGNSNYKNFDFNVFLQGIGKRDFMPTGAYYWGHLQNQNAVGTYEIWNNAWREDKPDAYYPIYKNLSSYNIQTQSRFLQSGKYIRLKNVTLGYTIPHSLASRVKITNLRLYASGYNLWEYSVLRGSYDPEQIGRVGEHYPMQRSILFGIEVTL